MKNGVRLIVHKPRVARLVATPPIFNAKRQTSPRLSRQVGTARHKKQDVACSRIASLVHSKWSKDKGWDKRNNAAFELGQVADVVVTQPIADDIGWAFTFTGRLQYGRVFDLLGSSSNKLLPRCIFAAWLRGDWVCESTCLSFFRVSVFPVSLAY